MLDMKLKVDEGDEREQNEAKVIQNSALRMKNIYSMNTFLLSFFCQHRDIWVPRYWLRMIEISTAIQNRAHVLLTRKSDEGVCIVPQYYYLANINACK